MGRAAAGRCVPCQMSPVYRVRAGIEHTDGNAMFCEYVTRVSPAEGCAVTATRLRPRFDACCTYGRPFISIE